MKITSPFTQHPSSVGETYFEHFGTACRFGVRMVAAGIACTIHAVLPFLFERTASECVLRLHERMTKRRNPAVGARPPGTTSTTEL